MDRPPCGGLEATENLETVTLGDLIRAAGPNFCSDQGLSPHQSKIIARLGMCRTAAMGGHLWACNECGAAVNMYNSCRDRHCPQCQGAARYRWVEDRMSELLPVPYFHVVFTLPHELNPWISNDPSQLLGLLFQAAKTTLLEFAQDPKHLGATPGILMVLHTWGQKLNLHYHVHCIVTGGGLGDTGEWRATRPDYLFPVPAMMQVFRGIYLEGLSRLGQKGKIELSPGKLGGIVKKLYNKKWVVYAKKPFGGPDRVLKYLGRYTHRVAISNSRILGFSNNMVTFAYKDYADDHAQKTLILPMEKFLMRFVGHILPPGFMRIRMYGIWSNPRKKQDLAHCRQLLGEPEISQTTFDEAITASEPEDEGFLRPQDVSEGQLICPHCKKGILYPIDELIESIKKPVFWDTS